MSQIFYISVDLSKQHHIYSSSRNALPKHGPRKAANEHLIPLWQTHPASSECHNTLLNSERKQNLLNTKKTSIYKKLFEDYLEHVSI